MVFVQHAALLKSFQQALVPDMAPPGYTNITIQVPFGTTNHSDPSLLCTPSQWTTVAAFYFGNYVAHAATVLSDPGCQTTDYIFQIWLALLFPLSGVGRGLRAIMRWANPSWRAGVCNLFWEQDVLRKAVKSGALCMIVKDNFKDNDMPDEYGCFKYSTRRIHGTYKWHELPKEYLWQIVPCHSKVVPHSLDSEQKTSENTTSKLSKQGGVKRICSFCLASKQNTFEEIISSSCNPIAIIVSIFQTVYGSFTLYEARGDQVSRYGYAAFGLTVAPYVVMSIVNLIGALVTPSYDTLYLVRSEALKELEDKGFVFDRTVGEFKSCPDDDGYEPNPTIVMLLSIVIGIGTPLAIIGIVSRFHTGESTRAERIWIMSWFGFGILGVAFQNLKSDFIHSRAWNRENHRRDTRPLWPSPALWERAFGCPW